MRILLVATMVLVWGLAAAAWPHLPERMPLHFDAAGRPDRWGAPTWWAWFGLPVLGTTIGAALGFLLPRWMVSLARRNSRWLNVPNKAQFAALPVDARERAVRAPVPWLHALVGCWQVVLAYLVFGTARVADGRWATLPLTPFFVLLAALLSCVVGMAKAGSRAVRREVERAQG